MQDVNALMGLKLTSKEIQELDDLVKEWMVKTIEEKMANKAIGQLRTLPDASTISSEMVQDIYQNLSPKRFFSIDEGGSDAHFRELLSIEFTLGFTLRANQVETMNAMLEDPNQVTQLGMGQGKSSVILPMLLHRLADGRR